MSKNYLAVKTCSKANPSQCTNEQFVFFSSEECEAGKAALLAESEFKYGYVLAEIPKCRDSNSFISNINLSGLLVGTFIVLAFLYVLFDMKLRRRKS
jgi:hypothetical protein